MKKKNSKPDSLPALRKKAERKLTGQMDRLKGLSTKATSDLVHELGTHQIELEMQNEELRRAQAELEESRAKYSDLYDFAPIGYFTFDAHGLIREVNLTGAQMLGVETRFLIDKQFSTLVHREDRDAFRRHCSAALQERTKQTVELRLKYKDKAEFIARLESIVVEDPDGKAFAVRTSVSNITEHRRAEDALHMSELHYRLLFDNMLEGYAYCKMLYDKRGRPVDFVYLIVNNSFENLTGLKNVIGMKVTDVIPGIGESHPELLETYGRVAATGQTEKFEIEFKPPGLWLSISVYSTERDYFSVVFDNITERKRTEKSLRGSEERHRIVLQSAMDGFWLVNSQERLVEVNEAYCRMSGYSEQELLGMRISDLEARESKDATDAHIRKVVSQGEDRFESRHCRKDGSMYDVEVSVQYRPTEGGQFVGFLRDITERKRAEEALKTAHREIERRAYELEAVNRELESFSYAVSHDLKAPLRSIDGFTRAILEDYQDKLDATGKDYLDRVRSATLRMNQFIEAMLSMARLTRGELHEKTVNLSALAQVLSHELRKSDPERRAEFVIAEKVIAQGDQDMLTIVLQNLLDNAWKFTGRHSAAKIEFGAVDMDGKTVFFVRDDGAGFDMQFAEKLFKPFKRLHAESEFPGLGIGLAIAHRIILRHGGRIWAESAPEKGATFYFTL